MTITATKLTDYELLDASGNPIRVVRGEGTAVALRNSGQCSSFRPVQNRVLLEIEPGTTVEEMVEFAAAAQAAEDEPDPEFDPTDDYLHSELIETRRDPLMATFDECVELPEVQWVAVERDVDVVELNTQFAMADEVLPEDAAITVPRGTTEPKDSAVSGVLIGTDNSLKPHYAGMKITELRKLASQKGMRAATGTDPYKGCSKDQLIEFLERP